MSVAVKLVSAYWGFCCFFLQFIVIEIHDSTVVRTESSCYALGGSHSMNCRDSWWISDR